jgi:hypothetical protein
MLFEKYIKPGGIPQQGFKTATENKILFYFNYTEVWVLLYIYIEEIQNCSI